MTAALWPLIYRERRRLLFVAAMAFMAGFLFYLRANVYIHGVHIAFITGTIYALVVGLSALLICLFLPSMRFMIEAVAVSRLLLSFFVLAVPNIGYQVLASPMLTAFVVVAGGAVISRLLHGRIHNERRPGWRGRLLPQGMFRRRPIRIQGTPMQHRIVTWLDDTAPIPA